MWYFNLIRLYVLDQKVQQNKNGGKTCPFKRIYFVNNKNMNLHFHCMYFEFLHNLDSLLHTKRHTNQNHKLLRDNHIVFLHILDLEHSKSLYICMMVLIEDKKKQFTKVNQGLFKQLFSYCLCGLHFLFEFCLCIFLDWGKKSLKICFFLFVQFFEMFKWFSGSQKKTIINMDTGLSEMRPIFISLTSLRQVSILIIISKDFL